MAHNITRTVTISEVITVDSVDNIELTDCKYRVIGDFKGDSDRLLKEINNNYTTSNHKAIFIKEVKLTRHTYRMSLRDFINNSYRIIEPTEKSDEDNIKVETKSI